MIRPLLKLIVLACGVLAVGCASKNYVVQVNALADAPNASAKRYVLLPGAKEIGRNDLQFREFRAVVQRALLTKGYQAVEDENQADFVVFMNYGVSAPQTRQYQYSVPIYGEYGGGYTTFTERRRDADGKIRTYRGSAYSAPQWGVVGTDTRVGYETTYVRFARLDAVKINRAPANASATQPGAVPDADDQPLWSITLTSPSSSGDLREAFPYLIAAGLPHIGANSGKQLTIKLEPGDPQAEQLR